MSRDLELALALGIWLSTGVQGAILEYSAEFSGVSHVFGGAYSYTLTSFTLAGPTPTFTGTLTSSDQFRLVYSAPAGQRFQVFAPPAGSVEYGIVADFWTQGTLISPWSVTLGNSYSFADLEGTAPLLAEFEFNEDVQSTLRAVAIFSGESFSFDSITLLFDLPPGINQSFSGFAPDAVRLVVSAFFPFGYEGGDPGPLGAIILDRNDETTVPEPATGLLAGVAVALGAWRRWKRRTS